MLLLLLLLIRQGITAQEISDTLELSPAEVTARRMKKVMAGVMVIADSSLPYPAVAPSIAEVLRLSTPFMLRAYGEGGITTLSYRGTSAHHSTLNWNGMPLNSSFLGMADLSMIILGKGDVLYLGHDASNTTLPGAGIRLNSSVPDSGQRDMGLELAGGSYGSIRATGHAALGGRSFAYRIQPYLHASQNDYRYLTTDNQGCDSLGRRNSAGFRYWGLQQHGSWKAGNSVRLSLHSFLAHSWRELPEPVGGDAAPREQRLKEIQGGHILATEGNTYRYRWQTQLGLHHQRYTYSLLDAEPTTTNALSGHFSARASSTGERRISSETSVDAWQEYVSSDNYSGAQQRLFLILTEQLRFLLLQRLATAPVLKLMIREGRLDIIPGLELTHSSLPGQYESFIRIASALRQPTFNDLYWYPGGNPLLRDERGLRSEAGGRFKRNYGRLDYRHELSFFLHRIRDWVAWRPEGTTPYWSPVNLGRVASAGLETRIRMAWTYPGRKVSFQLNYAYTRAGEVEAGEVFPGKQLTYTPEHLATGMLSLEHSGTRVSLMGQYQGRRITRNDGSGWLPPFATCDLMISHAPSRIIELFFSIRNITNTNYHLIAWYPMPRRTMELGLRLKTTAYEN
ncbi:MAG: TonB-dependent receptor [Bacteroidales bacterium]|nr:TonB-dependent receptor [Bacteroidales bacterium]